VMEKTQGNPFFVKEFLYRLAADELIKYSAVAHQWIWEEEKIDDISYTDNVVEFMIEKIKELPKETIRALGTAAAIASQFDLYTLGGVCAIEYRQLTSHLWEACRLGILHILSSRPELYQLLDIQNVSAKEANVGHRRSGTPVSRKIELYADIFSFTFYNMGIEALSLE